MALEERKQKITFSDFRISTFLNSEYFIVKSQKKNSEIRIFKTENAVLCFGDGASFREQSGNFQGLRALEYSFHTFLKPGVKFHFENGVRNHQPTVTVPTDERNEQTILTFEQIYSGLVRKCCQFADGLGGAKTENYFF